MARRDVEEDDDETTWQVLISEVVAGRGEM